VCVLQMSLGSMATNRYSAPFREDVQAWIVKLSTVGEIIEQASRCITNKKATVCQTELGSGRNH